MDSSSWKEALQNDRRHDKFSDMLKRLPMKAKHTTHTQLDKNETFHIRTCLALQLTTAPPTCLMLLASPPHASLDIIWVQLCVECNQCMQYALRPPGGQQKGT